jgi:selenium-binding protein 1
MNKQKRFSQKIGVLAASFASLGLAAALAPAQADETCQSPYMPKIAGQEDYVYVWTLGVEGWGDEQDKLVTIDVDPESPHYGEVVDTDSVGGRNEAHHAGLTDDRRFLWAGALDSNEIFIFDVHSDPGNPKLDQVITDFTQKSGGVVGPHTFYALPGRMMISGLSNNETHGGKTALVEYTNAGEYVATYWHPTHDNPRGAEIAGEFADGFGYDIRAMPRRNAMFTSAFTGWNNYMMDLRQLMKDKEAMKEFGNQVTVWDLHAREPEKVLDVPGSPLELRPALNAENDWVFTSTALTSKLWLIYMDDQQEWQAEAVATVGNPKDIPLPVDIAIAENDTRLWVDSFNDGMTRLYDISDPHNPEMIYKKRIGHQVNMVSPSWDGNRVYFTTSLLSKWDKGGAKNDQFFKAYNWTGEELKHQFTIDFKEQGLGRAHIMRFGDEALYARQGIEEGPAVARRCAEPAALK